MKKIIKILIIFFLLIILIFSYLFFKNYSLINYNCESDVVFTVLSGQNFITIGDNLEKEGVINNSLYFKMYVFLSGKFRQLKAGTYLFCLNNNIKDTTEALIKGKTAQNKITIIEGWNIKDIGQYFESLNIINEKDFIEKTEEDELNNLFYFLSEKPEGSTLEGYLFPDTYFIPYESKPESIIKLMLYNFNNKLNDDLKKEIKNQGKSIFEIVTVASLIEKEVRSYEDKKIVSGIIWKRLEIGMPLQIDATIVYITGKKSTKVSITETNIDSLYNTYKYKGLPIGPISNPGIESIKAAIYPEKSNYLFYLSKPDGETVFSEKYQDHVIAKNKYLK